MHPSPPISERFDVPINTSGTKDQPGQKSLWIERAVYSAISQKYLKLKCDVSSTIMPVFVYVNWLLLAFGKVQFASHQGG